MCASIPASLATLLLLVSAAACTEPSRSHEGRRRPRPNVLVIVTDDQRHDTMAVMRETRALFGDEGTRFPHAYATTPQCCPARASLMTGRYSHNHRVRENNDGDILDHSTTIQHYLRAAGYLTAMTGKFLQGRPLARDPENFARWAMTAWGYYDRPFNINGRIRTVRRYSTDFMASAALRYLRFFERRDRRPWFLYVAPIAAHLPYVPEERYRTLPVPALPRSPAIMELALGDKPLYSGDVRDRGTVFAHADVAGVFRAQMRTLVSVDDLVARLFARIDRLDETARTLAFFTSDNGHLLGEHGLFGKRLPYEAAVRVPLYMRWPGVVPAAMVDDRLAAIIDIAPTIADAAGLDLSSHPPMDGRSLVAEQRRGALLLEQYENSELPDWASLVTPMSQYIEYLDRATGARLDAEYYDLVRDPWQLTNLLARRDLVAIDDARRAAQQLHAVLDCRGSRCP